MPILESAYKAPKLFLNGHVQTIYPAFFRKIHSFESLRVRIDTRDNDFIDVDVNSNANDHVIIISHGLEGSSTNPYIQGMSKKLGLQGFDVIAWNFRSCSGEMNRQKVFYNASNYSDLELVINWAIGMGYKKVSLLGFSIGANLVAFYLGDKGISLPSEISSAMLISAPVDIAEATENLSNWHMGKIYTEFFLNTMRKKVIQKHALMDLHEVNIDAIRKARNFYEFDNLFTAPANGHKTASDYYYHSSSKNLLHRIKVPTLILNAINDPFLGKNCYPEKAARGNPNLYLETPRSGGHIGFICFKSEHYWSEIRAKQFFTETAASSERSYAV